MKSGESQGLTRPRKPAPGTRPPLASSSGIGAGDSYQPHASGCSCTTCLPKVRLCSRSSWASRMSSRRCTRTGPSVAVPSASRSRCFAAPAAGGRRSRRRRRSGALRGECSRWARTPAGASLRELMVRMGHSSTRAALIYQHSTDERQREIADALGQLARDELKRGRGERPDAAPRTDRARSGHGVVTMLRKNCVLPGRSGA
jgi:hypothetical protein